MNSTALSGSQTKAPGFAGGYLLGSYSNVDIADSTLYSLGGRAQSMELTNVSASQLSLEAESLIIAGGSSYGASLVANESVLISDGFKSTDLWVKVDSKGSGLDIYGGDFEKADLDFNTFETNIFGGKFSNLFIDTDFLGEEGATKLHGNAWSLNGEEVLFTNGIADISGSAGHLSGILSDGSLFEAEIFDEWNVSGGPQLLLVQPVPLPAALWLFLSSLGVLIAQRRRKLKVS